MSTRNRLNPKLVFEEPDRYLDFLTAKSDREFEGQYFDRKEVCRPDQAGHVGSAELGRFKTEKVSSSLSAFANENREGGLLALGIASNGDVPGLGHLSEAQINGIGSLDYLVGHRCQFKLHRLTINGQSVEIALIYAPYSSDALCQTTGKNRRAWKRRGPQNIELTDGDIEAIRRDKKLVDFERTHCSKFEATDVDEGLYKEFSRGLLNNASYEWTKEQLLAHVGAIDKDTAPWFTKAGKLFFSANPQRDIPQAFVRLLRFDVPYDEREKRRTPTYDKTFTGPLTKQIRDFRAFIQESAFFETYQRRKETGGFIEEPEYPPIAVDEAVVNAVAHRDYAVTTHILCEKYTDAFVVISPGTILQNHDLPDRFSLENTNLQHYSRNPKLMEWLRSMKDAQGNAFVQALQEGTRRMRDEMVRLSLPSPEYVVANYTTTVVLRNNAKLRKDTSGHAEVQESPEFTNLYPIVGLPDLSGGEAAKQKRREILSALKDKLVAHGWFIDRSSFGLITAHRRGVAIPCPEDVGKIVRLFPAYTFQVKEYFGRSYLLVDYTVTVQSVLWLSDALARFSAEELLGLKCVAQVHGWSPGRIAGIEADHSTVALFDYEARETLANNKIIPRLPTRMIKTLLEKTGSKYDLTQEIRKATFALQRNASKNRADYTQAVVDDLLANVFPLTVGPLSVSLAAEPLRVSPHGDGKGYLRVDSLSEPQVEFSKHHAGPDVRQGITEYGSYGTDRKDIEIVPLCDSSLVPAMESLINRLRVGKFKYKGSERTFSSKLTYSTVINAPPQKLEQEVQRLLGQHEEWRGNAALSRIFLIHCPEAGVAIDDENAPYYRIKRALFEAGIPCQMIDTPTLLDPDWKDLNLALNIVAKCGQTPWVLPQSIPDADFFVGLSYTQSSRSEGSRIMAFANVFNEYGRWEFYSGGSDTFSYEERAKHYEQLVKDTLSKLALSEEPTICFHYSARFSREDKDAILRAARAVRPKGTYVFVWINTHHNLRFYDNRPETNGSMARGRYVIGGRSQVYLSTTGQNPYRKMLGTPSTLELNIWIDSPKKQPVQADLRVLASQVLSLTKLNWASTDSLCAEPITIKYAGDIAYLTAAFMRQGKAFTLHPVLEKTPWFI